MRSLFFFSVELPFHVIWWVYSDRFSWFVLFWCESNMHCIISLGCCDNFSRRGGLCVWRIIPALLASYYGRMTAFFEESLDDCLVIRFLGGVGSGETSEFVIGTFILCLFDFFFSNFPISNF